MDWLFVVLMSLMSAGLMRGPASVPPAAPPAVVVEGATATEPAATATAVAPTAAPTGETDRKRVWMTSEFRCRAISTTRLRRCRIKLEDDRPVLEFPMSDIRCVVEFDEAGDPTRLVECRGAWLKIPRTNRLRKSKRRSVWSGSHRGWTWGSDGEEYCCPGMWLVAPEALKTEADRRPPKRKRKGKRKRGPVDTSGKPLYIYTE